MYQCSSPRSWSNIKNKVVLTILTFRYIQSLHLMYAEVAWVLVQPQMKLNPDYPPDYLSVSYDYVSCCNKRVRSFDDLHL